jgi:pSer/pThr/pTyr-binding forkhead associated (FHA) protein
VPLARALTVIGREPRAQGPDAALIAPRGASGNISRVHAEIRVREWTVEVVDLGSTNGTRVINPIGDPVQLEPRQPVPLLPGGVIDLAGEVSIRFEVTAS